MLSKTKIKYIPITSFLYSEPKHARSSKTFSLHSELRFSAGATYFGMISVISLSASLRILSPTARASVLSI